MRLWCLKEFSEAHRMATALQAARCKGHKLYHLCIAGRFKEASLER